MVISSWLDWVELNRYGLLPGKLQGRTLVFVRLFPAWRSLSHRSFPTFWSCKVSSQLLLHYLITPNDELNTLCKATGL